MALSMTGFARCETSGHWGTLIWELRSVNHRYLEITPRLPEELRRIEPDLRERAMARLGRGKVECTLRFRPGAGALSTPEVNWQFAEGLLAACDELGRRIPGAAAFSALDLLRVPGVLREGEVDLGPVAAAALEALERALEDLVASRAREGERLAEVVRERAAAVEQLTAEVRQYRSEVNRRLRERLLTRLGELDVTADPGRLEQELVYAAQRLDVDEELERLATHVAEVRAALERPEPVGRRLDFLMQELQREANTIASKSSDSNTTRAAVDMKVLIEQMREQVQNLE